MNTEALYAFYHFDPRPVDEWIFTNELVWQSIESMICRFPSYVLPSIDNPVAICGICHNGLGVGEVWLVTGKGFERQAPKIAKQLAKLCDMAVEFFDLHRLHMMVDSDRADAALFARRLGFVCEGQMKRMGARKNNVDVYLFERDQ